MKTTHLLNIVLAFAVMVLAELVFLIASKPLLTDSVRTIVVIIFSMSVIDVVKWQVRKLRKTNQSS